MQLWFSNVPLIFNAYNFRNLTGTVVFFFLTPFRSAVSHIRFNSVFRFDVFLPNSFASSIYPLSPFLNSYFCMHSCSQSTVAAFHRCVLGISYGKPAEERGLKRDVALLLFINLDGKATRVGIAGCACVPTMQPALCSVRYTITPTPTITAVPTSTFVRLSSWRK